METKDWIIVSGLILSFCTTLYALGVKFINTWERIEREKIEKDRELNKERLEALVRIAVREMVDEVKDNYAELIGYLKNGTFK